MQSGQVQFKLDLAHCIGKHMCVNFLGLPDESKVGGNIVWTT